MVSLLAQCWLLYAFILYNNAGLHIELQEKLLDESRKSKKPDEEFLHSLSGVVGSNWSSLAISLLLSEGEMARLQKEVGSENDIALLMLKMWASQEQATYGQLCQKLKAIPLFQYAQSAK